MNKLMLGLLTITTVSLTSLPGYAQTRVTSDDAAIQESNQEIIITGDRNNSNQLSIQENRQVRGKRSGNTGTVQNGAQVADIVGDDNTTNQRSVQRNRRYSR